jgi:DNA-binding HxlR family transcriptional regulator
METTMVDCDVAKAPEAYNRITEILGCKWSLAIFEALDRGVTRPGRLEKEYDGLTATVLHRCLNRLEADGLLSKQVFPEVPVRTEYALTESGARLLAVVRQIHDMAANWTGSTELELSKLPAEASA